MCRLPWHRTGLPGWGVALSVGPLLGGAFVGLIWSYMASRNVKTVHGSELHGIVNEKAAPAASSYGQVMQGTGPMVVTMPVADGNMMPSPIQQGSNAPRF